MMKRKKAELPLGSTVELSKASGGEMRYCDDESEI
jgi:hypothetical protein